jgi:hypothetical protein
MKPELGAEIDSGRLDIIVVSTRAEHDQAIRCKPAGDVDYFLLRCLDLGHLYPAPRFDLITHAIGRAR